jgi:hypothetical protein
MGTAGYSFHVTKNHESRISATKLQWRLGSQLEQWQTLPYNGRKWSYILGPQVAFFSATVRKPKNLGVSPSMPNTKSANKETPKVTDDITLDVQMERRTVELKPTKHSIFRNPKYVKARIIGSDDLKGGFRLSKRNQSPDDIPNFDDYAYIRILFKEQQCEKSLFLPSRPIFLVQKTAGRELTGFVHLV